MSDRSSSSLPRWDAVFVGSSLFGLAAAAALAQTGKRIAVMESQKQFPRTCPVPLGLYRDLSWGMPALDLDLITPRQRYRLSSLPEFDSDTELGFASMGLGYPYSSELSSLLWNWEFVGHDPTSRAHGNKSGSTPMVGSAPLLPSVLLGSDPGVVREHLIERLKNAGGQLFSVSDGVSLVSDKSHAVSLVTAHGAHSEPVRVIAGVDPELFSEPSALFSGFQMGRSVPRPTGWWFTLRLELAPGFKPEGSAGHWVYQDQSSPIVQVDWASPNTVRIQSLMPWSELSLDRGYQRVFAQRLFRVFTQLCPFAEYGLKQAMPSVNDPSLAEQQHLVALYPFRHLSEIPNELRVYGGNLEWGKKSHKNAPVFVLMDPRLGSALGTLEEMYAQIKTLVN